MTDFLQNIWQDIRNTLEFSSFVDIMDITFVAILIYGIIYLVRQTNSLQMAKGIFFFMGIYFFAFFLNMRTLRYLVEEFALYGIIAVVVVFQPELRRALEQMGRTNVIVMSVFSSRSSAKNLRDVWRNAIVEICDAAENFSKTQTGALIVIERSTNLNEIIKTGTNVHAHITSELLGTIFYMGTPMHDGAVVVRNGKIESAGSFLPLSNNLEIGKDMGTRHRAALGMSENSDAVIVIISEETGIISVAKNGVLIRRLERQNLFNLLESDVVPPEETKKKSPLAEAWRKYRDRKQQQ